MKRTQFLLLLTLIHSGLSVASAQTIDRKRAAALEVKLGSFSAELKNSIAAMEKATDLSELKNVSKNIELSSRNLLAEVRAVYPVDENYWLDAAIDNAVANDIQPYAPHTANVLRTRAAITTIQGIENEKAARPSYFERLHRINKYCKRISRSLMLKGGLSYLEKIKEEFKEMGLL